MKIIFNLVAVFYLLSCSGVSDELCELPLYAGWAFANKQESPLSDVEKIQLLKQSGYSGIIAGKIKSTSKFNQEGISVPGLYFGVRNPEEQTFESILASLKARLSEISSDGAVWLHFSTQYTINDEMRHKAIDLLQKIADWSKATGRKVSLYPHSHGAKVNFYWPNSQAAFEYLNAIDAPHLGLLFTVYHDMRQFPIENIAQNLKRVLARIDIFAMQGPHLIQEQKGNGKFYPELFKILREGHYNKPLMIYSRKFSDHSSIYLKKQKQAMDEMMCH